YDKERTNFLNSKGITIIRFNNLEVFESEELVCEAMRSHFENK
ncbi:DUF559 domain-containing protein, partial [Pedobacter suwonensis]